MITEGIAKYVYLDSTEKFNGEDTEKYTLTVALDDKNAKAQNGCTRTPRCHSLRAHLSLSVVQDAGRSSSWFLEARQE